MKGGTLTSSIDILAYRTIFTCTVVNSGSNTYIQNTAKLLG